MSPDPSLFRTILVARSPRTQPSSKLPCSRNRFASYSQLIITELELELRSKSEKIKVVKNLKGNAHMLKCGQPTVAIRVYYPSDLDKEAKKDEAALETEARDFKSFRDSYQFPVVFFLLPTMNEINKYLGMADSFANRVQMLMNRVDKPEGNVKRGVSFQCMLECKNGKMKHNF